MTSHSLIRFHDWIATIAIGEDLSMQKRFRQRGCVKPAFVGAALFCAALGRIGDARAQSAGDDAANHGWQLGAIGHAQKMRMFLDPDLGQQQTPPVIPQFELDHNSFGQMGSYQPGGPTATAQNAFFQNLGTNGRTCFTCHEPQSAWTVSAASVQARFFASFGGDPIFRLVDGAVCPSADVSSYQAKLNAYSLLISKGLIRIGLPMPANTEFSVASVNDPYNCTTNSVTGLTSPTQGIVSVYRRPLPSTNLGFLSTIMWDGREPSLTSQAIDATLGHAQAATAPTPAQQAQIVAFESGLFTGQEVGFGVGALDSQGAQGGPMQLQRQLSSFFIGINDPLGGNPKGTAFTPIVFTIYGAWENRLASRRLDPKRASIARGEQVFNNTSINITGVGGLNDALGQPTIAGFCGTCHDSPNVGNHSVKAPLNIGIANAGSNSPPALDISDLPVFTLQCNAGPLSGQTFFVTDPGRALISGKCADIGKVKGPILRGLASRAPYFHNGSAGTLDDVVEFYDERFSIGLTPQQKLDLAAFLSTL
jgi:cytochrome c peroxidase